MVKKRKTKSNQIENPFGATRKKKRGGKIRKIHPLFRMILNRDNKHKYRYISLRNFNFARISYPGDIHPVQSKVVSLDYNCYICEMKKRQLFFYKDYFDEFYNSLSKKVQAKILWTFRVVEDLDRIPEIYFKHIENTDGLYEIRIQVGSDIFRIFCFFDLDNIVVVGHGFQKKTQKTPISEIQKAINIKKDYYENK